MTIPATPAGWYPDPAEPAASRWWDGSQWTDHRQQPYDPTASAAALAPNNTRVYTPWIWLIVFLPYLTLPLLFTVDTSGMFTGLASTDPNSTSMAQLEMLTSPGYLALVLTGFLTYGLCALFAFLDRKALIERGVPRPFHWAWTFLSSPAYAIGRSVIVRRRTGRGIAPMWAAIAMYAVSLVVSVVWMGLVFSQIFQQLSTFTSS
ncbi:Protein of unknown function [Salinibacterium xinjiangense]|uniref:DUF2510 domain-containing protein n=2 Tax=Salinibacterium xinjiangense TaxID=386302 RepID=A0A2C8ZWX9_9MICO|nr:DUF2510 domain-containing protein [Salinibacterium xinjiangense]SOE70474.1 Protein of unknown function [Salinibacterium xinjiangense]